MILHLFFWFMMSLFIFSLLGRNKILFSIIYSFAILVILPVIFIFLLWRASFKTRLEWLLDVFVTVLLISWLFQSANWSWIGHYFRFFWPVALLFALYFSWKKTRHLPFTIKKSEQNKMILALYVVLILVFGYYNFGTIKSYTTSDEPLKLTFPLKNGTYYVAQGGNHELMNYHQVAPPQKYALDILKLNSFGLRANGLYPKELEKYHIYGDDLYSPCHGEVIELRNDVNDVSPPEMDTENVEGNFVKLLCDDHDAFIFMAHLQKGSIVVSEGERINVEQKIGKIGNSGNTTEPHLHIHAELNGVGVPITFNERFLVRNSLIKNN